MYKRQAQAYRSVVAHSQERGARRTLTAMVRNAVRASDAEGALSVETLDGVQTLCFTSAVDGEEYIRYLYVYDGALRELFISAQRPFDCLLYTSLSFLLFHPAHAAERTIERVERAVYNAQRRIHAFQRRADEHAGFAVGNQLQRRQRHGLAPQMRAFHF